MSTEQVNHPSHYNQGKFEVIEIIEDQQPNFHLGNAIKYICRAGKKNPEKTVEDLEKAIWYIKRFIEIQKPESERKRPNDMNVRKEADRVIKVGDLVRLASGLPELRPYLGLIGEVVKVEEDNEQFNGLLYEVAVERPAYGRVVVGGISETSLELVANGRIK